MPLPDIDSFASYGGRIVNYQDVEDPTTDRDAAAASAAYLSTAALTQTCPRAWARFLTAATTGAMTLAVTNPNDGAWPNIAGNKPVLARTSAGIFTLTWPATLADANGVTHTLNFRAARACAEGATYVPVQCSVTAPNVVTVYVFVGSAVPFVANDVVGTTILVEVV